MQVTPRAHISPDVRAQLQKILAQEYRAGATVRMIASRHGMSYGRANRILSEAGVDKRARGRQRAEDLPD